MGSVLTAPVGVSVPRQAWNFVRHFLEMCVPMCVIGTPIVLAVFSWGPSVLGYADPRQDFLGASLLAIAVIYTLPMVAWMRFRGMAWRPVLEMGAATVGVGVLMLALAAVGILGQAGLREFASAAFCGPACLAMIVVMFTRLDLYTGRTGHHM